MSSPDVVHTSDCAFFPQLLLSRQLLMTTNDVLHDHLHPDVKFFFFSFTFIVGRIVLFLTFFYECMYILYIKTALTKCYLSFFIAKRNRNCTALQCNLYKLFKNKSLTIYSKNKPNILN